MEHEESIVNKTSGDKQYVFTLSARSRNSLNMMRNQLAHYLSLNHQHPLESIAFTLNTGREHFEHRFAIITNNISTFIQALLKIEDDSSLDVIENDLTHIKREYLAGKTVNWNKLYPNNSIKKVHLPGYCFDMKPYWFDMQLPMAATENAGGV